MSETDLGLLWLARVPYVLPHVLVFRRSIVRGMMAEGWYASSGIAGHGDAFWYASPSVHRHYAGEVEWKARTGRMRESQTRWRARCELLGIPYLLLRAAKNESESDTVERWVDELKTALA